MNTLITIAGVLMLSAVALILLAAEALIGFLLLHINWSLVFVIALAVLVILSVHKSSKQKHNGKPI